VSFAAITLCVASQRAFIVVVVVVLDILSYFQNILWKLGMFIMYCM
jgi:hypothetical protein